MKFSIQKELPLISVVLLPFIYLKYVWNDLPQKVPVHWNLQGEIDRYGSKMELWLIPILLPLLSYIIFLIVPHIDPKGKIKNMGAKYGHLKMWVTLLMSVISIFILYTIKNQPGSSPDYIIPLLGVLLLIFGNYFQTLKANYFIGIRTPWTLENEMVWKRTHRIAGKLWFVGGLVILLGSSILDGQISIKFALGIISLIGLFPILYSYLLFRKLKNPA
ncbi:Uncharacterized membrane protein [Zobellia uliginosa]|uniref:Uncharacterized membrane protein n=1 Tax=Zobellia uliginosa TaxID=143224 RepID=A0ABY1KLA8_9FLAO|nr:SdpI family protein [Zobellia uliginosa]SIS47221.1 Uncharacterized membrane protein [Zobellia uliginosa]